MPIKRIAIWHPDYCLRCFDNNNTENYNKKPTFTECAGTVLSVSHGFILFISLDNEPWVRNHNYENNQNDEINQNSEKILNKGEEVHGNSYK